MVPHFFVIFTGKINFYGNLFAFLDDTLLKRKIDPIEKGGKDENGSTASL